MKCRTVGSLSASDGHRSEGAVDGVTVLILNVASIDSEVVVGVSIADLQGLLLSVSNHTAISQLRPFESSAFFCTYKIWYFDRFMTSRSLIIYDVNIRVIVQNETFPACTN